MSSRSDQRRRLREGLDALCAQVGAGDPVRLNVEVLTDRERHAFGELMDRARGYDDAERDFDVLDHGEKLTLLALLKKLGDDLLDSGDRAQLSAINNGG